MRSLSEGEYNRTRGGVRDEMQAHNRIHVGQITSVNPENGTIHVTMAIGGKTSTMVMPLNGMSAHQDKSAWQRFMPDVGDFIKVGFTPDRRAEALGPATWGTDASAGSTGGRSGSSTFLAGGYAALSRLRRSNVLGLAEFVRLKPGEFDSRSSGGAYIKGARHGTLLAGAGCAKLELDKQLYEMRARAGLVNYKDSNVEVRWGDVKRKRASTDTVPTRIFDAPAGDAKEYVIKVGKTFPSADPLYEVRAGNVYEDTTTASPTEVTGGSGQVLRYRSIVHGAGSAQALRFQVDVEGNIELIQDDTASVGMTITGGVDSVFAATFKDLQVQMSGNSLLEAQDTNDLSGATVNINAGGTASSQHLVQGENLLAKINELIMIFNAHVHPSAVGPTGMTATPQTAHVPADYINANAGIA